MNYRGRAIEVLELRNLPGNSLDKQDLFRIGYWLLQPTRRTSWFWHLSDHGSLSETLVSLRNRT